MQPYAALLGLTVVLQAPAAAQYSAEQLEELKEAPTRNLCFAYWFFAKYVPAEAENHPIRKKLIRRNAFTPEH